MPNDDLERRIAAAICSILGSKYTRRDIGGTQIRDFDLVFADKHVEPLEITEASIESIRQTQGRLRTTDREAPSLSRWWSLDMPSRQLAADGAEEAYDIRRLLDEAEGFLGALEAAGRTSFDIASERYSVRRGSVLFDPSNGLFRLGVSLGSSLPAPPGEVGRITLGMTSSSTGYGEPLSELVLAEANDEGNCEKLKEPPGAPHRHLGVLLHPSVGRAYHSLRCGERLDSPPGELPLPITNVWALADRQIAWVTPPGDWDMHAITDSAVFDAPEKWEA